MSDALFAIDTACGTCGRPHVSGSCTWCAGTTPLAAVEHATTAVRRDVEWQHRADRWRSARIGQRITADDLVFAIGLPCGSTNQVGAIFHRWRHRGLVEPDGYTTATRGSSHGRVIRLWVITA